MYTVQIKTNKGVALWSSVCNWMVTEITTDNNLFEIFTLVHIWGMNPSIVVMIHQILPKRE